MVPLSFLFQQLVETHPKIMLKKTLKILAVIVTIWLVSLLSIVREYKHHNKLFFTKNQLYEEAMKKFSRRFDNGTSEFTGKVKYIFYCIHVTLAYRES